MYNSIGINDIERKLDNEDKFSLRINNKSYNANSCDTLYTEAVFSSGKKKVEPLLPIIEKLKNELDERIDEQEKSEEEARKWKREYGGQRPTVKMFDPKKYWKNESWKDLEAKIGDIFGFRIVEVYPYVEKYSSIDKMFQSKIMNCSIYFFDRYPIEGLVSNDGFYDKTKSLTVDIRISLGVMKELTTEEILAVLLHEFGHGVDPALVDIRYTQTNILAKYITDRKNCINKHENKLLAKIKEKFGSRFEEKYKEKFAIVANYVMLATSEIKSSLFGPIENIFIGKDKAVEKKIEKIREMVRNDKSVFRRQEYSEAFADNFARMYGYGPQLMSGLHKMQLSNETYRNSRIKKEKARQAAIMQFTQALLKDVHKTDIHRVRALIKEYNDDINDPNTPPAVKKQLKEDLEELEKVLDQYLNNFSDFQNRVNRAINEELINSEKENSAENNDKKE